MTIETETVTYYYVVCDECGGSRSWDWDTEPTVVIPQAVTDGWEQKGERLICDGCAAAMRREGLLPDAP